MILDNFNQWLVANTPFHETTELSQPKGRIQGNLRIGPVLEVTTSFQHFKYGIEIRIESVNQDDSHSWVRSSYGTVKYVNDSFKDDTEKSSRFTRREHSTSKHECGCSQVEGKSKTSTEGTCLDNNNHTHYVKEDGLTLNHQNKILTRTISRRKSSIFLDIIRRYIEKKMEQLNFAR